MYSLDVGLAASLASVFRGHSVIEFGAGMGCYTGALLDEKIDVTAYDGVPDVHRISHGLVPAYFKPAGRNHTERQRPHRPFPMNTTFEQP